VSQVPYSLLSSSDLSVFAISSVSVPALSILLHFCSSFSSFRSLAARCILPRFVHVRQSQCSLAGFLGDCPPSGGPIEFLLLSDFPYGFAPTLPSRSLHLITCFSSLFSILWMNGTTFGGDGCIVLPPLAHVSSASLPVLSPFPSTGCLSLLPSQFPVSRPSHMSSPRVAALVGPDSGPDSLSSFVSPLVSCLSLDAQRE
jgi:hypothetical protein